MWFLSRFDRRNTEQHSQNMGILRSVESKIDRLDEKSDHLDFKLINLDRKVDDVNDRVSHLESKKATKRTKQTD